MKKLLYSTAIVGLLAGLPLPLLASQNHDTTDSGDSATEDVTPNPSPGHIHKHAHSKASPASSPGKHRHSAEADESTEAIPTANPSPSALESNHPDLVSATAKAHASAAQDASLAADQLKEYSRQPQKIRDLIEASLELTRQNLTYTYSSADPANGGMDCSGFIYYVLTQAGIKDVPRDASGQYSWIRKANKFRAVISRNLDGFELSDLKPGDLLFWSGTYKTEHDPPVTHTMLYLGREKETGNRVMVGSSDGRTFHGLQRWGVSVFDFNATPAASPSQGKSAPLFIGYGTVPGF